MSLQLLLTQTTQSDLAEKLGVSQGLISQWLTGKTVLTPERAVELSKVSSGKFKPSDFLPEFKWE